MTCWSRFRRYERASAGLPEHKKIHREPAALDGLHAHIDAMIGAEPDIAIPAIWERPADEHGTTVARPDGVALGCRITLLGLMADSQSVVSCPVIAARVAASIWSAT